MKIYGVKADPLKLDEIELLQTGDPLISANDGRTFTVAGGVYRDLLPLWNEAGELTSVAVHEGTGLRPATGPLAVRLGRSTPVEFESRALICGDDLSLTIPPSVRHAFRNRQMVRVRIEPIVSSRGSVPS